MRRLFLPFQTRRLAIIFLLLSIGLLITGGPGYTQDEAQDEPPVLAYVPLSGPVDRLDLPIYAHLQGAGRQEYVLVVASLPQLEQAGVAYQVLDRNASAAAYVVALERRTGARQRARQFMDILHDDGRYLVIRATAEQAETLAALGLDVQRLPHTPLLLHPPDKAPTLGPFVYNPHVAEMIAQVQQSTVYTYTGQLSGEWATTVGGAPYTITTRHTNSGTPVQKATQYVYEHLQGLGLGVSYHSWSSMGYSNRNVIGVLTGTVRPDEIVLVTAHLDDVPSGPMAPGADDNASGSVGVLVAADILSQYSFERTVRFVLFTGEEQGLLGSDAYAALVHSAGDNIVAVYNMDMIGWDSVGGPTLRLHTRTPSNPGYAADLAIASVFTNVVQAYGLASHLTPILDPDGISASDHASFWNQGYAAILAIEDDTSDFNTYYHTTNDRLQYLNLTYFTNYVKASVGTVAHLAQPAQPLPPQLSIAKSGPEQVETGNRFQYVLRVENAGGPASGVTVTDTLPVGTLFAAASNSGTPVGNKVVWSGLQVGAGSAVTLTLDLTVTCVASGTLIVNDAYAVTATEWPTPTAGLPVTVTATAEGVKADFSFSPSPAARNGPVTFNNLSRNATAYEWNFGDGVTSTLVSPSHPYAAIGTYTVVLTASNPCGANVVSRTVRVEDFGLSLATDAVARSADPGQTVTYTLHVTNTGTLTDTFRLSRGTTTWTTTLSTDTVMLPAGEAAQVQAYVTVPANAAGGARASVRITAQSQSDPRTPPASASVALTTTANNVYGVALGAAVVEQTARAGEVVTYTLRVTNTGNVADTVTITRTNPGWPTAFSWTNQTIARGGWRELRVTITVPVDVFPGDEDVAVIRASGSSGAAEVTLTTRTPVHRVYLPLVIR